MFKVDPMGDMLTFLKKFQIWNKTNSTSETCVSMFHLKKNLETESTFTNV